jgi:hypothetical protein
MDRLKSERRTGVGKPAPQPAKAHCPEKRARRFDHWKHLVQSSSRQRTLTWRGIGTFILASSSATALFPLRSRSSDQSCTGDSTTNRLRQHEQFVNLSLPISSNSACGTVVGAWPRRRLLSSAGSKMRQWTAAAADDRPQRALQDESCFAQPPSAERVVHSAPV